MPFCRKGIFIFMRYKTGQIKCDLCAVCIVNWNGWSLELMINPKAHTHFAFLDFRLIQPFTAEHERDVNYLLLHSIWFDCLVLLVLILLDSSLGFKALFVSLLLLFGLKLFYIQIEMVRRDKIDRWPGKKWLPQWRSFLQFYLFSIALVQSLSISVCLSLSAHRIVVLVFGKSELLTSVYSSEPIAIRMCERDISNRFSTMVWSFISHSPIAIVISAHFPLIFSFLSWTAFLNRWTVVEQFSLSSELSHVELLPFQISIKKQNAAFHLDTIACLSSMILTFIAARWLKSKMNGKSRWHSWSQIRIAQNYFQIATAL